MDDPMRTALVTLLMLALILSASSVRGLQTIATDGGRKSLFPDKSFRLLDPIAELLSGPVWLHVRGFEIYPKAYHERMNIKPLQGGLPIKIPYRTPSPKFSRNLLISRDVGQIPFQAETAVAINPLDPENVVVGLNDYGFFSPSAYMSMDGGVTWDGPFPMSPLQKDDYGSDVSLAFDRNGTAYFAYMSIGWKWVRALGVVFGEEKSSIVISRSEDGGRTWSAPITASAGDIYAFKDRIAVVFLDRPRIAVGPDPEDLSRDRIYVTYTEFILQYPLIPQYPYVLAPMVNVSIKLVYSKDGGETWSDPKDVSPIYSYWFGEMERRIVQGSDPKVSKDGRLYVAYYDSLDDGPWGGLFSPTIVWSDDGGNSFSDPVHVDYLLEMDYELPPTIFRAWVSMMPQIDVGPDGEVYLVVAARPRMAGSDDSDIFFYRSLDGGKTWSTAKRLNDDETTNDQFIPFIAVSPNGTINVAWADRRLDPKDVEYHIYYTRSGDRGEKWIPNTRVTDAPSNPNYGLPYYIGDYFGMAATDDEVYITWTDTRLGRPGSPDMKIGFARLKHIPLPTILISPPSGVAGQKVTLVGENFVRDREVFIKVGDAYVSVIRTDDEGRFKADILMPMLGEGPYQITAIDVSGNRAQGYFYAEFGVDTLRKRLAEAEKGYESILKEIHRLEEKVAGIKVGSNETQLSSLNKRITELEGSIRDLSLLTQIFAALLIISISATIFLLIKLRGVKR